MSKYWTKDPAELLDDVYQLAFHAQAAQNKDITTTKFQYSYNIKF